MLAVGHGLRRVGYITLVVVVGTRSTAGPAGSGCPCSATALVALAFQPLRRQVVRLADRLAYGSRAQPYEALSDFSRRLAETPDPDALLPAVAEAAGRAVSARARDRHPATSPVRRGLGAPGATARPDGTDAARRAGPARREPSWAASRVPCPRGRALRPSDERLLEALADQAAVAFRNTALRGPARRPRRRARPHHPASSRASRARIIEADDAARRTLEAAISREVLPHLVRAARRHRPGAGPPSRPARRAPASTAGRQHQHRARGAARADPRRLPHPARPGRARARPAVAPGPERVAARLAVDASAAGRRFSARVEAAVYFCCAEAVRDRSGPRRGRAVAATGDQLVLRVRGDPADRPPTCRRSWTGSRPSAGSLDRRADGLLAVTDPGRRGPAGVRASRRPSAQASESRSGPNAALATYAAAPQPSRSNSSSS